MTNDGHKVSAQVCAHRGVPEATHDGPSLRGSWAGCHQPRGPRVQVLLGWGAPQGARRPAVGTGLTHGGHQAPRCCLCDWEAGRTVAPAFQRGLRSGDASGAGGVGEEQALRCAHGPLRRSHDRTSVRMSRRNSLRAGRTGAPDAPRAREAERQAGPAGAGHGARGARGPLQAGKSGRSGSRGAAGATDRTQGAVAGDGRGPSLTLFRAAQGGPEASLWGWGCRCL